jgi:hypothetical protein
MNSTTVIVQTFSSRVLVPHWHKILSKQTKGKKEAIREVAKPACRNASILPVESDVISDLFFPLASKTNIYDPSCGPKTRLPHPKMIS